MYDENRVNELVFSNKRWNWNVPPKLFRLDDDRQACAWKILRRQIVDEKT